MSAYVIAHYNVEDGETYAKYPEPAMKTIADHGGTFKVVAGAPNFPQPKMVEGSTDYAIMIIIEFPSQEAAEGWYNSPEYQKIIGLRTDSTQGWLMMVQGFEMPG